MTRFVRSGTNHEGREWFLAPCLNVLANQIEAKHPDRHPADGTVASAAHDENNPWSDHRPTPWAGKGRVDAIDFGETVENDAFIIAEAIRRSRDARVKYLIHEDRIFSSYAMGSIPPYTWREYTGPNPHSNHGHLSILDSGASDIGLWEIGVTTTPKPTPPPTGGTYTVEASRTTIKKGDRGLMVKKAMGLLAAHGLPPANSFSASNVPDGIFGTGMDTATRAFQKKESVLVDGIIGPVTWSRLEN